MTLSSKRSKSKSSGKNDEDDQKRNRSKSKESKSKSQKDKKKSKKHSNKRSAKQEKTENETEVNEELKNREQTIEDTQKTNNAETAVEIKDEDVASNKSVSSTESRMSRETRIKMENIFVQFVFIIFAFQCGGCAVLIAISMIGTIRDAIRRGEFPLTAFASALLLVTIPLILVLHNKPHLRKTIPCNYIVFGIFVIPQAVAFAIYSQNLDTWVFLIFYACAAGLSAFIIVYGATKARLTARKVRYGLAAVVAAQILFCVIIVIVMSIDPKQQQTLLSRWKSEVSFVLGISFSIFCGLMYPLGALFKVCHMIRSREYDIEYNDYLYPVSLYICTIIMYVPMKIHTLLTAFREESESENEEENISLKSVEKTVRDDCETVDTEERNEDEMKSEESGIDDEEKEENADLKRIFRKVF